MLFYRHLSITICLRICTKCRANLFGILKDQGDTDVIKMRKWIMNVCTEFDANPISSYDILVWTKAVD